MPGERIRRANLWAVALGLDKRGPLQTHTSCVALRGMSFEKGSLNHAK